MLRSARKLIKIKPQESKLLMVLVSALVNVNKDVLRKDIAIGRQTYLARGIFPN